MDILQNCVGMNGRIGLVFERDFRSDSEGYIYFGTFGHAYLTLSQFVTFEGPAERPFQAERSC